MYAIYNENKVEKLVVQNMTVQHYIYQLNHVTWMTRMYVCTTTKSP